ncbi:Fungal transcriptional regulatory [Fusarium albosuccineum]|uniref:Fungal transcriptional regulatory n=1 Tax=Fusarium albosuccineum TaxID=1237068 RepID=A0A8H4LCG3_9HYPO|nr:Fungal transcriptional regulatory [Fusarium albosuccineum]
MPKKLPACDPCRASKLACDHAKPVCIRCRDANRSSRCRYRDSPFKKRKRATTVDSMINTESPQRPSVPSSVQPSVRASEPDMNVEGMVTKPHKYPNPGWLGTFSYTTLFDNLPGMEDGSSAGITPDGNQDRSVRSENKASKANVAHGAKLVEQIRRLLPPSSCYAIIQSWTAKDTNLAIANMFVERCAQTVQTLLLDGSESSVNAVEISRRLFTNSCYPLFADPHHTIDDYSAQFCGQNPRWETLGLFCTAVSRAVTDLTYPEAFCDSDEDRRHLQRLAMHFSDLFLQYENFILHSMVDGDQSYHSWKRLGDMSSSLFALGHHQQSEHNLTSPAFLVDLRRAVFARAYSADKNVSIFLGRPHRIHRKHCRFYLPDHSLEITGRAPLQLHQWEQDTAYGYMFETQWTALCAILKEEVLDIFDAEESALRTQKAEAVQRHAHTQWDALPSKFRLEGPLKISSSQPVMRDFLVSARLNHLHILFLLRLALVRSQPQFDPELAAISAEMLGIVIESIMLKDQLANSGTSLVWKVAYYGLAAAGVLCLWLLSPWPDAHVSGINRSKIVRNLSVLVAEMETGTLVQTDDSNYKVLTGASQTIGNLLDRLLHGGTAYQHTGPYQSSSLLDVQSKEGWNPWDGATLQDFETDFWLNLAEHPFLLGNENENQSPAQPQE